MISGEPAKAGSILEVDRETALVLIRLGKAAEFKEEPVVCPAKPPAKEEPVVCPAKPPAEEAPSCPPKKPAARKSTKQ